MKMKLMIGALVGVAALAAIPALVSGEEKKAGNPMEAWTKAATPGAEHKQLAWFEGKWTGDATCYMCNPGKAEKSTATEETKSILGGRFIQTSYSGSAMGKPMNGVSIIGYSNTDKTFECTWIDDMSTATWNAPGTYDAKTKTYTFNFNETCPVECTAKKMRYVMTIVDDNTYTATMFMGEGKDEVKAGETTFKRNKTASNAK